MVLGSIILLSQYMLLDGGLLLGALRLRDIEFERLFRSYFVTSSNTLRLDLQGSIAPSFAHRIV